MDRKSVRRAGRFVFQIVGALFQIGAPFVLIAGTFLVLGEVIEGQALGPNDLGVVCVTSGIALLLMGALMVEKDEAEEEHRFGWVLGWSRDLYHRRRALPLQSSKTHNCPSCGYADNRGVFFCEACNSPIWPMGTPKGQPPVRAVVKKRKRMIAAKRKTAKILLASIIVIIATLPIWWQAVIGYSEVSDTWLTMTVAPRSDASQVVSLDIVAYLWSHVVPIQGEIIHPTFTLTVGGVVVTHLVCPDATVYGKGRFYACTISTITGSQYGLETNWHLTMDAVLRFGLYQATITRAASL